LSGGKHGAETWHGCTGGGIVGADDPGRQIRLC
jgi:hypothetical protein